MKNVFLMKTVKDIFLENVFNKNSILKIELNFFKKVKIELFLKKIYKKIKFNKKF
jgi:hypothetical protein